LNRGETGEIIESETKGKNLRWRLRI